MTNEQTDTAVVVTAGTGADDAEDFAAMLREMYRAWNGPLYLEPGIHRLVRNSPFDPQHRRQTSFARVDVAGVPVNNDRVRTYVLYPYTLAKHHKPEIETPDVAAVLAGDLSPFYSAS